jgi:hypothetical protein
MPHPGKLLDRMDELEDLEGIKRGLADVEAGPKLTRPNGKFAASFFGKKRGVWRILDEMDEKRRMVWWSTSGMEHVRI